MVLPQLVVEIAGGRSVTERTRRSSLSAPASAARRRRTPVASPMAVWKATSASTTRRWSRLLPPRIVCTAHLELCQTPAEPVSSASAPARSITRLAS